MALYFTDFARTHKATTVVRRAIGIAKAHRRAGLVSPTEHESVRLVLAGIRRSKGMAPEQVLADSAYGSDQTRADLGAGGHTQAIKPIALRAAVLGGFTKDDFAIDTVAGTVTCPAGQTVAITPSNKAVFGIRCRSCPLMSRCTTAKGGRTLQLHPHEAELIAARRRAEEPEFNASYPHWRPMVERSIAWLVADDHRRVRYRGVRRNQFGLSLRVAAINLRRLVNLGLDHDGTWVLAV